MHWVQLVQNYFAGCQFGVILFATGTTQFAARWVSPLLVSVVVRLLMSDTTFDTAAVPQRVHQCKLR